ncbi:hypothetical protein [Gymnodinialimonas ceratoperidinii]|uniref:Uncharacterized protein n=1 Tax=Gymnodinialimonas ceratoperidinii TaxID=2856823 RepID=A0A8F6TZZ7_9RHOB|nr:hypothetical protein [Gymnodinialimonas ceratoperidinii]QXT40847.1 hypothetical protein KYE46_06355 [Gymnodinialimonas ceratoperidinii]
MSDLAKTPGEIEDVLASVRRLVSDHAPARDDAPQRAAEAQSEEASSEAPASEPEQPNALVLTPSFRVTDPEDPWVPVPETSDAPEPQADAASDAEDLVSELMNADSEGNAAAEPHADTSVESEPAPEARDDADWQPDDRLASFDVVGSVDGDAVEDDRPLPEPWVDGQGDAEAAPTQPEDAVTEPLRLDGAHATDADFEPESDPADFESETGDDDWPESSAEAALLTLVARREPFSEASDAEAEPSKDDAEPEGNADTSEAVAADGEDAPADAEPEGDAEQPDAATVAPTEAAFAPVEDQHTSDATPHLREVGTLDVDEVARSNEEPAADEHAASEAPQPEPRHPEEPAADPVEDLGDERSPFTFPETDEGILDEDTLREIIVEVVREELQGVLGQRITRNVRKMVRREIRLALAAEDLE